MTVISLRTGLRRISTSSESVPSFTIFPAYRYHYLTINNNNLSLCVSLTFRVYSIYFIFGEQIVSIFQWRLFWGAWSRSGPVQSKLIVWYCNYAAGCWDVVLPVRSKATCAKAQMWLQTRENTTTLCSLTLNALSEVSYRHVTCGHFTIFQF